MKKSRLLFSVTWIFTLGVSAICAGTISYVAIPSGQSDANCGISTNQGYTSAVDGGNTTRTDRVINGITLSALSGAGQNTATADNCTVNALAGTLSDGGVAKAGIQADGTMREVLSDVVFNNAGGDNSQIEVVLDPDSLEQGSTYDLRVYVCSSSGQNRQVNLAFFGDGQSSAETGFFNEDDARTSAGRFQSANQVYYINFRYTWDGDSTPGITITQKSGGAPFCLYALTNELVEEGGAATGEEASAGGGGAAASSGGGAGGGGGGAGEGGAGGGGGDEEAAGGGEGDDGLSSGYVDQESDEVGVQSDDFYNSESLNSNGKWIKLSKWGTCWQPTNVESGWCPYTNGQFSECDDCGWTFVSDEPWAWACYHYGRWCKVKSGCGWAWVPGKTWAASWVSWRRGTDDGSCSCIGWAPLPPEAGCEWGVGISSWVDETCNIGPGCYTFINIRDFGSSSYSGCGCIYDRGRNSTIITDTFNCTNIWHGKGGTYCGGPDYNWCNTQIRKAGGKECGKVYVNRYDNPGKNGGKFAKHEGNQLGLVSPHIKGEKNPQHRPKTSETLASNKIDHGWGGLNKKQQSELKNHYAKENNGKNPKNSPAKLSGEAAQNLGKHHGAGGGQGAGMAGQGAGGGGGLHPGKGKGTGAGAQGGGAGQGQGQASGFNQHPGGKGKGRGQGQAGGGNAAGGGQGQGQGAGFNQHPGKGKGRGQGQAGGGNAAGGGQGQGAGFNQHPGGKGKGRGQGQGGNAGTAGANALQGGNQQAGGGKGAGGRHPGQSLKKGGAGAGGAGGGNAGMAGAGGQGAQGGGQHPGKHKGKGAQGGGQEAAGTGGQQGAGGQAQGGGAGKGTKGRHKGAGQTAQGGGATGGQGGAGQNQAAGGAGSGGGAGAGAGAGGKGHKKSQLKGQGQTQGTGQAAGGAGAGGGAGGGKGKGHKQQQSQVQGKTSGQAAAGSGGGGGQGKGRHPQGQGATASGGGGRGQGQGQGQGQGRGRQQVQQQQQQQYHPQGGGGGGGGRGAGGGGGGKRKPTPTPAPRR